MFLSFLKAASNSKLFKLSTQLLTFFSTHHHSKTKFLDFNIMFFDVKYFFYYLYPISRVVQYFTDGF